MKICDVCNNAVENDLAVQCPYCGSIMSSEVKATPVVPAAAAAAKTKGSGKKTGLLILVVVIIVAILGVVGVLVLKNLPSADEEEEEETRHSSEKDEEKEEEKNETGKNEGEKGKNNAQTGTEKDPVTLPADVEKVSIQGALWSSADNNISLSDAVVVLQSEQEASWVFETRTDANGRFNLEIPVGDYLIRYECDGYESFEEEYTFDVSHSTYFGEMRPEEGALAAAEPEPTQPDVSSEYILYGSDQRYITEQELDEVNAQYGELGIKLARNEFYARYGRGFTTPEVQQHFDACSWYEKVYEVTTANSASVDREINNMFNDYEKTNVELIQNYEKKYHLNGK